MRVAQMSDQKEYEKTVAEKFLAELNDGWRIQGDDSESPDFVLTDGTMTVGLELTGYREQGAHNEAFSRDSEFRQFIYEHWREDATVNHVDLFLAYRKVDRRFTLPKKACWSDLLDELRTLVRSLDTSDEPSRISFDLFEEVDEDFERFLGRRQRCVPTPDNYPLLCSHFYKVMVSYDPGLVAGPPTTSIDSRNTGADIDELQRVLEAKIKKVPEYRANLPPGAELWLLIHNNGWPSTAHIANEIIMEKLLTTAHSILAASGEFVSVYWFANAYVRPSGPLHVVYRGE